MNGPLTQPNAASPRKSRVHCTFRSSRTGFCFPRCPATHPLVVARSSCGPPSPPLGCHPHTVQPESRRWFPRAFRHTTRFAASTPPRSPPTDGQICNEGMFEGGLIFSYVCPMAREIRIQRLACYGARTGREMILCAWIRCGHDTDMIRTRHGYDTDMTLVYIVEGFH